jgi:cephalosporin-C deacetylase-like acetyl esterase
MRNDLEFRATDGTILRGWHFRPATAAAVPTIIISPGFSMVKEMGLDWLAEHFAKASMATLVFDHRNLGASDGSPRSEIDPLQQIRDIRDAITFAETLPGTDLDRIGLWGTSYGGAHALVVSAIDRRVKCVSVQVPTVSGHRNLRAAVPQAQLPEMRKGFDEDRRGRMSGRPPVTIPIVAEDPSSRCLFPSRDTWEYFKSLPSNSTKTWRNEVTLRSVEYYTEYEPGIYVPYISPTPLQMIVALNDVIAPPELALAVYENALHPKKLVTLRNGHFEPQGPGGSDSIAAMEAARDWFVQHLMRA